MRILAVRGQNLASLAAPFEVAFDQPPLAEAGLFAITGPTGSGKSTILDAVCLALFDRVPRLPGGRGVAVGRASDAEGTRTLSTDVRSLLRRGAAEGFAEVDFLGGDGQAYRARWEVRRARRKPEGRIQQQQLKLIRLDSMAVIGHTKTEVLQAISERLGLTFEQFRRSVLLAQGDFAAFLKADNDDRAGLLERITGTELYSEISKAAYRRSAEEQAQVAQVQARLGDMTPLSPEERGGLEKEESDGRLLLEQAEAKREVLRSLLIWHERDNELATGEGQARQAFEAATAEWEDAADRRDLIRQVERMQPLRPRLESLRDLELALAKIEKGRPLLEADMIAAQKALATAESGHKAGLEMLTQARKNRDDQRQPLKEARQLDERISSARRQAEMAASRKMTSDEQVRDAAAQVEKVTAAIEAAQREQAEAEAWVKAHGQYEFLVAEWPRWEEKLRRYARVRQESDGLSTEQGRLQQALEDARRQMSDAQNALRNTDTGIRDQSALLLDLESRQAVLPGDDLRSDRRRLDAARDTLLTGQKLARDVVQLKLQTAGRERRLEAARAMETASAALVADRASEIPLIRARLEEVGSALNLALASSNAQAEHLRSLLAPGQPCPVCGSDEHPWSTEKIPADAQVQKHRDRQRILEAEILEAQQQQADAEAQRRQSEETVRALLSEEETGRQQRRELARAWDHLEIEEKPALDIDDRRLPDLIEESIADIELQRRDLADKEKEFYLLATEAGKARRALEAAQNAAQEAAKLAHNKERECVELEGRLREASEGMARRNAELEEIAASLERPFVRIQDWQMQLETDPDSLIEQCIEWEHQWNHHISRRDSSKDRLSHLHKSLAGVTAELTAAESHAGEHRNAYAEIGKELAELTELRQSHFYGEPADKIEQGLYEAVNQAELGEKNAAQALTSAQRSLATANEMLARARNETQQRRSECESAQRRLDEALAEVETSRETLERLLACEPDWRKNERGFIDGLEAALAQARITLVERTRLRKAHQDVAPEEPLDEAKARAEALDLEIRDRRDGLARLELRLRQDDEKRERSSELTEILEQQSEKAGLWAAINELIGSADGKKFRVFAQSLTLEALLAQANEHLKELSRRYRLQRVPGSDLDLQVVDSDMGDEVRSVHSLSGGESFLVSLGLALGLSSLSSDRAQVESLFIDEGFGSLDQDALDVAIASLDRLQSLGRQVGVISHVPTLVERIGVRVRVAPEGGGKSRVSAGINH